MYSNMLLENGKSEIELDVLLGLSLSNTGCYSAREKQGRRRDVVFSMFVLMV